VRKRPSGASDAVPSSGLLEPDAAARFEHLYSEGGCLLLIVESPAAIG
jgi:hypothetical protein